MEVTIRHHALESGCFVVNSTGWLTPDQKAQITTDEGRTTNFLSGGCFTAIINPKGEILGTPITEGEGMAIADLDFSLILNRKRMMDSVGHYAPVLTCCSFRLNQQAWSVMQPMTQPQPAFGVDDASESSDRLPLA